MRIETVSSDRKSNERKPSQSIPARNSATWDHRASLMQSVPTSLTGTESLLPKRKRKTPSRAFLEENGFIEPTIEYLNINLPSRTWMGFSSRIWSSCSIASSYLLNKATGRLVWAVSERAGGGFAGQSGNHQGRVPQPFLGEPGRNQRASAFPTRQ